MTENELNKKIGRIRGNVGRTKKKYKMHQTKGREQSIRVQSEAIRKWEIIRFFLYPKYRCNHFVSFNELAK